MSDYFRVKDPVFIASGHTYDRRSIAKWFQQGHKTCPSTGQRLRNTEITPNFALRNAILEWAKETKFLVHAEGEELLRNVSQKPTVQIGGTLQFGDDLEHDDDVDDDDSEEEEDECPRTAEKARTESWEQREEKKRRDLKM